MLPRSCVPGILGTRARRSANFIQERRNLERERIGTLNSRSCEEMTQLWCVLRGEVEGVDCGRDTSLTLNWLPASIRVHRSVASWPGPPDPSMHRQRACDELHLYPPHIRSLTQEHRNAKQERGSTEEREKNVVQERGNAEREGKI